MASRKAGYSSARAKHVRDDRHQANFRTEVVMHRAVSCTVVAIALIAAAQASAQQLSLSKTVRSGISSRLAYERSWDHACTATSAEVSITQQPEHGTASVVQSSSAIPASTPRSGSTGQCAGRQVTGNEVVYRSQPGFHGRDRVSWSVIYGNGKTGATTVDISVR